ncbi:leucine-rich repeat-containing protein 34-like isoform X1 [Aricia agestis]|uniref:leucine-rich repeat-containing protein 34-like isoform X1 n=1 Tax=Aricia agestis TaxID=91739 RepID=UPI001C203620|nr:leucine-rich repeat-containing protein 34-like isoform X1 [Aricia agestis]
MTETTGTSKGGIFARRRTRFADTSLSVTEFNDIRLGLLAVRRANGTARLPLHGRDMQQRYGARLADADVPVVCFHIRGSARRVTHLDLSFNVITDAGFLALLEHLLALPACSVTHLDVANNELTGASLGHLVKYAETIGLKHLRLAGNELGRDAGERLARFLAANDTVTALDVGDTSLTLAAVAAISAALRTDGGRDASLRALDLSRILPASGRYPPETKWLAYHVELLLQRNVTLTELHLRKNALSGPDVEAVVRGLRHNGALLLLDLASNGIGDRGAELLADYLGAGPPLRVLNVAGNGIRYPGARALSLALPFSKVRALDVGDNRMTDDGVLDVLTTIKKPYYVQILRVWGNEVGPRSCTVIERMLRSGVLAAGALDVRVYGEEGAWRAARCGLAPAADRACGGLLHRDGPEYGCAQPVYRIRREAATETPHKSLL